MEEIEDKTEDKTEGTTQGENQGENQGEEYIEGSEDFDDNLGEDNYGDNYENNQEDDFEDDYSEQGSNDYGGSDPQPLGGLYGLFKDVSLRSDSTKFGNISKEELGALPFDIRGCLYIANIAETFKHPGVATFFRNQAKIITDTSMAKGGWFTELFVTSKKHASRESSSNIQTLPQPQKKNKWKMFSKRGNQPEQ